MYPHQPAPLGQLPSSRSTSINAQHKAVCVQPSGLGPPSALALLSLRPGSQSTAKIDDESEFSYDCGAENWPENWGKIKEWATCRTGRMQSPIDLSDRYATQAPNLGYLNHSYRSAKASI
ncbi:alpha carbonic anhydrase 5-like, partial [Triticum dicoccoides]|uniref:alpha carbonic anhydrase 5-like n=1 Tax=Triticum dicoccoides TaxID=85692 RepID=UPI0018909273